MRNRTGPIETNPRKMLAVRALVVAAVTAGAPALAIAAPVTWQADGGVYDGQFNQTDHWDTGNLPGSDDTAIFNPSNQTYTVSFTQDATNSAARITAGNVQFDLSNGVYTTTATGAGEDASLYISGDNASLTLTGGTMNINQFNLGRTANSGADTGALTVTGSGTTLTVNRSGDSYVGYWGNGTLTIENGATVGYSGSISNATHIGRSPASSSATDARVLVTGENSTWNVGNTLYVGESGVGYLTIADGGHVTSATSTTVGKNGGANGSTVTVTGENSSWSTSKLYIGNSGHGKIIVENGGHIDGYQTWVRQGSELVVTGDTSVFESSSYLYVGDEGSGTLTLNDGGTVNPSSLKLFSSGTLNLGNASGGGIIQSNLTSTGGTIHLINANQATKNVTLDADSTLTVALSGTTMGNYGQLNVTGALTLAGSFGVALDGYTPVAGDTFQIFTFGSVAGTFSAYNSSDISSYGLQWDYSRLAAEGILSVSAVPEPASAGLLLGMCGWMVLRRRR